VTNTRILIVEDHPTMREAMRLVLEGEGFVIDEAADGQRALEMMRTEPPDLVFLDMNMPGSSGAEVLTEIRADPVTAGIRVIVVTADGEEGRGRAMAIGADEYFTKPFSPITLLSTVEQVLSSPAREPEA
jgi:two-component system, OmpR family, phosphate regulon response regulator PhoB